MAARPLAILVLALAVPVSLAAQGLGDVAARERAKRQKQAGGTGGAGKTFSNGDLERGKPAGSAEKKKAAASSGTAEPAPSPESATVSAPESEAPPSPPAEPSASQIPELEARIKTLQDKLNPMSGSYIFGPFGSNDPTEEPRAREELQRLEAELAEAREAAARPPAPALPENPPDI